MKFFLIIVVLIFCGCSEDAIRYDEVAEKEYFFECLQKLPPSTGSKAVEECRNAAIMWGMYKAREKKKNMVKT